MAYVAVKGGERAIDNAHAWLAEDRRGGSPGDRITKSAQGVGLDGIVGQGLSAPAYP